MSKITVVLLRDLPASAFSGGHVEEMQQREYVALTDGSRYLIAGINKDHDSKETIKAHFRANGIDPDLPLPLVAMMNSVPLLDAADVEGATIDEVFSVESAA